MIKKSSFSSLVQGTEKNTSAQGAQNATYGVAIHESKTSFQELKIQGDNIHFGSQTNTFWDVLETYQNGIGKEITDAIYADVCSELELAKTEFKFGGRKILSENAFGFYRHCMDVFMDEGIKNLTSNQQNAIKAICEDIIFKNYYRELVHDSNEYYDFISKFVNLYGTATSHDLYVERALTAEETEKTLGCFWGNRQESFRYIDFIHMDAYMSMYIPSGTYLYEGTDMLTKHKKCTSILLDMKSLIGTTKEAQNKREEYLLSQVPYSQICIENNPRHLSLNMPSEALLQQEAKRKKRLLTNAKCAKNQSARVVVQNNNILFGSEIVSFKRMLASYKDGTGHAIYEAILCEEISAHPNGIPIFVDFGDRQFLTENAYLFYHHCMDIFMSDEYDTLSRQQKKSLEIICREIIFINIYRALLHNADEYYKFMAKFVNCYGERLDEDLYVERALTPDETIDNLGCFWASLEVNQMYLSHYANQYVSMIIPAGTYIYSFVDAALIHEDVYLLDMTSLIGQSMSAQDARKAYHLECLQYNFAN